MTATLSPATRIAVLHGPDPFLREQHTNQLREALIEAHVAIDTLRFDGATATLAEVLDECRTFGLMSQHKLVIVDDADHFVNESTRPALTRYAQSPADNATLILRASKWNKGNLDKAIEKVGAIVKCDAPTRPQAVSWAINRCTRRHGATLARDAAARLVDRVGPDLARIDTEIAKLASRVGDGATIDVPLVDELVEATSQEEVVWPLQDTLLRPDPAAALRQLRDMLEARLAPTLITFACLDLARKLHAATEARAAGHSPQQTAGALKLWGPSKDAILSAAGRLDRARAAQLLSEAVQADAAQKSGLGDPIRSIERLVLRFPSLLHPTPDRHDRSSPNRI